MTITIPLNWGTSFAFAILFVYVATRIGAREHTGWIISKRTLAVVLVATLFFCAGLNWDGVAHMFSFMFRG